VERTLADLARSLHGMLLAERLARGPGLLQRLDPRAKIVVLAAFVVLACLQRTFGPVLALLALAAVLAALSRVPARVLFGRVGLAVGLFVGLVTLPAALNVVTPGAPLLLLWREPFVAVTSPGLALVAFFVLRAVAAAGFGLLLALTTPWGDLLAGLRALRAPRLFLDLLGMTWRYFTLLLHSAAEMFTARRSRAVGAAPAALERSFLGGAAAALFGRTLAFAEEVHDAMLARGWTSEARGSAPLRFAAADGAWLGLMSLLAAAIALWGARG
jgi:cobalt ECF transporter T component CbiQ